MRVLLWLAAFTVLRPNPAVTTAVFITAALITTRRHPMTDTSEAPIPRTFTIRLPAGLQLINENQVRHWHWRKERRVAAKIRETAAWLARSARIPALERARIAYVVHLGDRRKFDPHNWNRSAKAAVDGLVDAKVLPDDDYTHLPSLDPRAGEPVKGGQLDLIITEISS